MSKELFYKNLPRDFVAPADPVGRKMLLEYGAMLVAAGVALPPAIVFADEREVSVFQAGVRTSTAQIGGFEIELQTAALRALETAIAAAAAENLSITPRNADSAKRSYRQTVENWRSRVEPGLDFWVEKGKLAPAAAARLRALSPIEQIPEIFALEERGIFFAKGNQKTIIYSVAPPGASQHIALLALDVAEFDDPRTREILADHGWFQTVPSDLPHFTYLGLKESELAGRGLKKIIAGDRPFWVPDL